MALRALGPDETAYLEDRQRALNRAMQARYVTWGLLALPFAFLLLVLGAGRPLGGGDRVAAGLAVAILLVLVGGMVFYGREGTQVAGALRDMRLLRGLNEDLLAREARVEAFEVTGKLQVKLGRGSTARRELYLLAGLRRFQVGAARFMATAVGDEPMVEFAPHSEVVLVFDGERERVLSLVLPTGAAERAEEGLEG